MKRAFALVAAAAFLVIPAAAQASTVVIPGETGIVAPSYRGDANTTWVGWDSFDDFLGNFPANPNVIFDNTPDIGTDSGSFATINGEDHLSGSGNVYTGSGSLAEEINFDVPASSSLFTTIVVQGNTLFGGFGSPFNFSDIDGNAPTSVVFGTNAVGQGQFFTKYEIAGPITTPQLTISSGPFSFVSLDKFTVDVLYSNTGFASDTAVAVPEPSGIAGILGLGMCGWLRRRRR